jgi:hypothetical protein
MDVRWTLFRMGLEGYHPSILIDTGSLNKLIVTTYKSAIAKPGPVKMGPVKK